MEESVDETFQSLRRRVPLEDAMQHPTLDRNALILHLRVLSGLNVDIPVENEREPCPLCMSTKRTSAFQMVYYLAPQIAEEFNTTVSMVNQHLYYHVDHSSSDRVTQMEKAISLNKKRSTDL